MVFDDDYIIDPEEQEEPIADIEFDDGIEDIEDKEITYVDSSIAQDFCDSLEVNTGLTFRAAEINEENMSPKMRYYSYACYTNPDGTVTLDWITGKQFNIGDAKSFEMEVKRAIKEIAFSDLSASHYEEELVVNVSVHSEDNQSKHTFQVKAEV